MDNLLVLFAVLIKFSGSNVNYYSEYMIILRVFIVKQLRLYLKITK